MTQLNQRSDDDQSHITPGTTSPMSTFERPPNNSEQPHGAPSGPAELTPEEIGAFEEAYGLDNSGEANGVSTMGTGNEDFAALRASQEAAVNDPITIEGLRRTIENSIEVEGMPPVVLVEFNASIEELLERIEAQPDKSGFVTDMFNRLKIFSSSAISALETTKAAVVGGYAGQKAGEAAGEYTKAQIQEYAGALGAKVGEAAHVASSIPFNPLSFAKRGVQEVLKRAIGRDVLSEAAQHGGSEAMKWLSEGVASAVSERVKQVATIVGSVGGYLGTSAGIGALRGGWQEFRRTMKPGARLESIVERLDSFEAGEVLLNEGEADPRHTYLAYVDELAESGQLYEKFSKEDQLIMVKRASEVQADLLREQTKGPELGTEEMQEAKEGQETIVNALIEGNALKSESERNAALVLLRGYHIKLSEDKRFAADALRAEERLPARIKAAFKAMPEAAIEATHIPKVYRLAKRMLGLPAGAVRALVGTAANDAEHVPKRAAA
jgi:hypothetical protein